MKHQSFLVSETTLRHDKEFLVYQRTQLHSVIKHHSLRAIQKRRESNSLLKTGNKRVPPGDFFNFHTNVKLNLEFALLLIYSWRGR